MTAFVALLSLHVVVAVLGIGPIAMAAFGQVAPPFRLVRAGLAVVMLSGIAMELVSHGMWHDRWWFRLSVLLLVIVAVLVALAQRRPAARKPLALAACAIVAIITILMVWKPA